MNLAAFFLEQRSVSIRAGSVWQIKDRSHLHFRVENNNINMTNAPFFYSFPVAG